MQSSHDCHWGSWPTFRNLADDPDYKSLLRKLKLPE